METSTSPARLVGQAIAYFLVPILAAIVAAAAARGEAAQIVAGGAGFAVAVAAVAIVGRLAGRREVPNREVRDLEPRRKEVRPK